MILAVGLTPAWQQILRFDRLEVGEVNRAREAVWCASGKVLNVAIALAHLGATCELIAPLGGLAREPIQQEFDKLRIPCDWIESNSSTRVCTTLLDSATQSTTELVENARPLSAAELHAFVEAYTRRVKDAEVVVLSGSLPSGAGEEFYRELLHRTGCRAVVDAQGPELLAALHQRPCVVKPNREELERTLGQPVTTDDELLVAMRELIARGAQWVVVTQGTAPVWIASADRTYRLRVPPASRVVNPIGCGDCLAAGLAWGLAAGDDVVDAVRLGMAAAAENVAQLLPARVDTTRVRQLAASVSVECR